VSLSRRHCERCRTPANDATTDTETLWSQLVRRESAWRQDTSLPAQRFNDVPKRHLTLSVITLFMATVRSVYHNLSKFHRSYRSASLCLDTVSARMGVGHLLLPAQLSGTHCVIRRLALTVLDVCLKLGCFQSTSTHSALEALCILCAV